MPRLLGVFVLGAALGPLFGCGRGPAPQPSSNPNAESAGTVPVAEKAPPSVAPIARLPAPRWQPWEEPNERAFTFLLPAGWKVRGGLKRPSSLGYVTPIEITSPDGEITIISTDELPFYHELSDAARLTGYRIGSRYTDEWGVWREIQNHAPGEQYLLKFFLPKRGKVAVTASRAIRAVEQRPFPGLALAQHAGEVEYRIRRPGDRAERHGAALALTTTMSGTVRQWAVSRVLLYEAPPARMEEAKRALLRFLLTTHYRPSWVAAEMKGARDRMNIALKTQRQLSDLARQSYWDWQESRSRILKKVSDVIGDKLDVFDPHTGTVHYGVSNRHNYYWLNRRGEVVGTNLDQRPDIDHRPLVILP